MSLAELTQPALLDYASFSSLPLELIHALNQTYFLHLLVTVPQKVIPPGKSLLSMMTHANFKVSQEPEDSNRSKIMDRVKEMAHRAFWNEALEQLSYPLPSVQITRLNQLYLDLHESLTPLFPPNHPILTTLSSPLPPTSSPLHSTINLIIDVLKALRKRCAPVRDQMIDDLLETSSHPPLPEHLYETPDAAYRSLIAELVIDKFKALLILAEDMKADLNTFVLGAMTESQLQGVLLNEVKIRERELVLKVWGGNDDVRSRWRSWISQPPTSSSGEIVEQNWINRLFRALESDQAIQCMLPSSLSPQPSSGLDDKSTTMELDSSSSTSNHNELPPQLFFSTPSLLSVQNHLQAIVIAAALRSLTRIIPPHVNSSSPVIKPAFASDFMPRIWALLEAELDDEPGRFGQDSTDKDGVGHTKVINLADEVVRARRGSWAPQDPHPSPPLNTEEEKRLRAAVERTLRSADPVFLLLKKRLVSGIEKRVIALSGSSHKSIKSPQALPTKMQTGKDLIDERVGKRPRLNIPESILPVTEASRLSKSVAANMEGTIPGFEDSVLQTEIQHVLQKIIGTVGWIEGIWGDLV